MEVVNLLSDHPEWLIGLVYVYQVLLVPTTESLIGSRDRESNLLYSDLVASEEFLGSHVLRIPIHTGPANPKEENSVRENRGKAKQVTTFNGRTVIIKDNSVYSNKGESTCWRMRSPKYLANGVISIRIQVTHTSATAFRRAILQPVQ